MCSCKDKKSKKTQPTQQNTLLVSEFEWKMIAIYKITNTSTRKKKIKSDQSISWGTDETDGI
jgi:hypothetical protein